MKNQGACSFCVYQRIALAFVGLGSALWLFSKWKRALPLIIKLALLCSFLLGSWHVAIQLGLAPDICAVPTNVDSIEQFHQMLSNSVSSSNCAKITWKMFGVPASVYNAIASIMLLVFHLCLKRRD